MRETSFLVMADLHADGIPDAVARMEMIARVAEEQHVDFLIQLGDMQYPEEGFLREYCPEGLAILQKNRPWATGREDEKLAVRALLEGIRKPVYSVIGNHDLHVCDKETMCRYWGLPGPYYAFMEAGIRFLVLDTNMIRTRDGLVDMAFGNSSDYSEDELRFLSDEQYRWLEQQLKDSKEPCILLSHASLADPVSGIHDRQKVLDILSRYGKGKVLMAMNGHGHVDGVRMVEGIPFWDVNSVSYHYTGERFATVRYSRKLCTMYPTLPFTAPYAAPLYAVVRIRENAIEIHGTESSFVGPTPQELGMPETENDYPPTARIRDRSFPVRVCC